MYRSRRIGRFLLPVSCHHRRRSVVHWQTWERKTSTFSQVFTFLCSELRHSVVLFPHCETTCSSFCPLCFTSRAPTVRELELRTEFLRRREGRRGKVVREMWKCIVLDCQVSVCVRVRAWQRAAAEALVPVLLAHSSPQGSGRPPACLPSHSSAPRITRRWCFCFVF